MRLLAIAIFLYSTICLENCAHSKTLLGVAKTDITPTHPVLLAGYGGRPGEHVGVDQPIWARSLAIGDTKPVVLIAVDNCGVPAHITRAVLAELKESHAITESQLVISSTHTHNAPALRGYAKIVWAGRTTDAQEQRVDRYTLWLTEQLIKTAQAALDNRQPASLSWGQGIVDFGGNRRVISNGKWAGFGFQQNGPVDHSLPVMAARNNDGNMMAVWTNYACHCTTVGGRNHIGGDWAGNSNLAIEELYEGAIALTTIGCGADVGPQPSGNMEIAKQHGASIATEVKRVLSNELTSLPDEPQASFKQLSLPLDELPDPKHFEELAKSGGYHGNHAKAMVERIKNKGRLQSHVDYPVTCWKFDDDLAIVFLAGEVAVDYSVRLKNTMDWRRLWINGWSNDVPSYIPSKRLLKEGGYETDFSQIYYALPARYSPEIEDLICNTVVDLVGESFANTDDQPEPTFLKLPTSREWLANNADTWASNLTATQRREIRDTSGISESAINGFSKLNSKSPKRAVWFDFTGKQSDRAFFRQEHGNESLAWETKPLTKIADAKHVTLLFLGGTGWISQPESSGFTLQLNDDDVLKFDATTSSKEWSNPDTRVNLKFVCTWNSDVDSAGFFFLRVPTSMLRQNEPLKITVKSAGTGSLRWFSVDEVKDSVRIHGLMLNAVLRYGEAQK